MFHCTKQYGVRLHAFSPRLLNSYCYKPCGCDYTDKDLQTRVSHACTYLGIYRDLSWAYTAFLLGHIPCCS